MSSNSVLPHLLSLVAIALMARLAEAQQRVETASVSVSLRVLPQSSFDGGAERRMSAEVVPGTAWRVVPGAGVRTRLTYSAATQVVVTGTPLVGPGGTRVRVRFVCAFGDGMTVSADEAFDCVGGLRAGVTEARTATMPLAIGAELSARETLDVPDGLYSGRLTLTASYTEY